MNNLFYYLCENYFLPDIVKLSHINSSFNSNLPVIELLKPPKVARKNLTRHMNLYHEQRSKIERKICGHSQIFQ